tara:strand:- start:776 stop:934 length:159 start_codon:yes stop_codon:yes gene_type:complete
MLPKALSQYTCGVVARAVIGYTAAKITAHITMQVVAAMVSVVFNVSIFKSLC